MALDIKQFAVVARATNAMYYYVTDDAKTAVTGANYFKSKDLSGNVKPGDIIFVLYKAEKAVDSSVKTKTKLGTSAGVAILYVKEVNTADGSIVVAEQA